MLKDPDCPVRTINPGCTIPNDMRYFEDWFQYQSIKLFSEPSADKTADQINHQKLCRCFAHVLKNEEFNNPTEVVWLVALIVDGKIGGTAVFNVA